jgi:hypothetical protein
VTCPECRRRSALIAALALAISRLSFTRNGLLTLLTLLTLPNARLLHAAKVEDPYGFWSRLRLPLPTHSVPTALCRHDPDYPEGLAQLPSAPAVLYATCTTERLHELLRKPTVAIVGARRHTEYAHKMTLALARDLATAGVTIISGIDKGLEGTVHQGALHAGGQTIAMMPGAPEIPYSTQDKDQHRYILARAAAISEFPSRFLPLQRWCFIANKRIIAALARVVVVVENRGDDQARSSPHRSPPTSYTISPSCRDASPTPAPTTPSRCCATARTPSAAPRTRST